MASAKSLQKDSPAGKRGHHSGNGHTTASEIKESIGLRQIPSETPNRESLAHELIARAEAKTNPVPKTVRGGTDARHDKKGNFRLQITMDREPSIFFNQVIGRIGDGKLADEIGHKVCPQVMIEVFRAIDPRSFSRIPSEMHMARDHVFEVLDRNHDAIHANIWMTNTPTVSTVMEAIQARRRISRLFIGENEIELLEGKIAAATKCPGWLPIETTEGILAKAKTNGGLSFERIMHMKVEYVNGDNRSSTTLFSLMQRKGAELVEARQKAQVESRHQAMPMSEARIGMRVRNSPDRYPLPEYVRRYKHGVTGDVLVFTSPNSNLVVHRSRIILFAPLGLEVAETGDGTMVAVVSAGKGVTFAGLSMEEQEFLGPHYKARVLKEESKARIDPVLARRLLLSGPEDYYPTRLRL